jgi:hypothetical protein
MGWSLPISSDDVVAIHAALVPTANGDGEIILFGGDNHSLQDAQLFEQRGDYSKIDHTRRFNCRHPNQPLIYVHSPAFDIFCCGHAFLGDGRILVAGGTAEFPDDADGIHKHRHFDGHRHCAAYNPFSGAFVSVADMGAEPGHGNAGGGRWYPTLCTLGSGEVFIFQGHPGGDDTRHGNNAPERYQPGTNSWVSLPPIGDVSQEPILYPRLHLLNNGSIFVSSRINGYNQTLQINPWNGGVQEVSPLPDEAYYGFNCPSVLLPLVPADGYRPRVLLCGGLHSQILDLGNPSSGWKSVPRNGTTANQARTHACATLLPTGDVLLTGGALPDNDQIGVNEPEIYRTPLNRGNGTYTADVGHWDTINEPAHVLRNYHSTALLMPDGRVWTAGGNSAQQPGTPPTATQKQIEIYDPPYPAGARPTISTCPSFMSYGEKFTVGVPNADKIGSVVLMRCGSSTHAYNPDQRAVWLSFNVTGGSSLTATTPPNGNIAPPGNYMLFVVDREGRPCEYARFVRITIHKVPKNGSSNFIQSRFGQMGNFELVVPQGNQLVHYWRDNDDPNFHWHRGPVIYDSTSHSSGPVIGLFPTATAATLIESNLGPDGNNLELIVRLQPHPAIGGSDYLTAFFFEGPGKKWQGPFDLVADGQPITGVTGDPVFIQSRFGQTGNFELVVPQGNQLVHYWRDNDDPNFHWHRGPVIYDSTSSPSTGPVIGLFPTATAAALIESNLGPDGSNLELIVRLQPHPAIGGSDYLTAFFFEGPGKKWQGPFDLVADGQPITGVTGDPVFIQSRFGQTGNFELVVPQGNQLVHYWRDNDDPNFHWHRGPVIYDSTSHSSGPVIGLFPTATAAALIESNLGPDGSNLELIVRLQPHPAIGGSDYLTAFFFEGPGKKWQGSFDLVADSQPITGVTGF